MKKTIKKLLIIATVALTLCATVSAATGHTPIRPLHEQDAG